MKKISLYILPLILIILAASCSDDDYKIPQQKEALQTVTLNLNLPGDMHKNKSTKSMTEEEDQGVNAIDVLAFTDDGYGNYIYSYKAKGTNIAVSNGSGTFKVTLHQHPRNQILVIVANASDEVDAFIPAPNENINTAIKKLTVSSVNEWDANNNNSGIIRYIPMYCKTPPITISNSTTSIGPYYLIRMLARFDISVKSTVTNFELVNACIFNRYNKGYIAYDDAKWDGDKVTAPDVPVSATKTKLNTILFNADASHKVIRSIYSFEANKQTDRRESTAIVVGGRFENQSHISYYRIDVPTNETGYFSGDILRNYLYDIEIQKVEDEGSQTPEIAFDGEVKITATVTPWNLVSQNIIFDGIYTLVLDFNKSTLNFRNILEDKTITIETNHPNGVSLSPIDYDDPAITGWLDINQSGTNKWKVSTTNKNFKEKRSGNFIITVGNLEYTVPVAQRGCGSDGTVEIMEIGNNNNSYNTYMYNGKCWMVENSRSGIIEGVDFSSSQFGRGGTIVGLTPPADKNYFYYYTWEQASRAGNACPDGWHLPTVAEYQSIIPQIMADPNSDVSKYWTSGDEGYYAHTGYYYTAFSQWHNWKVEGMWWCKANDGTHLYVSSSSTGIEIPTQPFTNDNWLSVRCVKD